VIPFLFFFNLYHEEALGKEKNIPIREIRFIIKL